MTKRLAGRAAALAALVLVFTLALAAPALAGMRLEAPSEAPIGTAFFVRVVSDEPMDSVHITWGSMALDAASRVVDGGGWEVLAALGTGRTARLGTGRVKVVVRSGGGTKTLTQDVAIRDRKFAEEHLKVAPKMVHLTEEQLARHKREKARMLEVLRHVSPERYWSESFTRPVAGGVSSTYGLRRFFNGEARRPHAGLDLRGKAGTPVKAAAPGVVAFVDDTYFGGNTVFVDHGLGVVSMYCHLSAFAVKEGEFVSAGQKIGEIGATGRVTGPHLHFGLAVLGQYVDPLPLITDR
ncbi:M23 family metallopeptidase [Desulfocurvus sp. DL9XJH121]